MTIVFKIFHLEDSQSQSRNSLYENALAYLKSKNVDFLDSTTTKISNKKELESLFKSDKKINIDLDGYSLDGIHGWRFGEIGIWSSNIEAIKIFLETDYESVVLMEDDIIFNDNFYTLLLKYLNKLPKDFDIFSMFVPQDQYHKYSSNNDIGDQDICRAYHDWSMLCYVVSKHGAKKILEDIKSNPISLPLDWYFYRQQHKFNVYTVKPESDKGCMLATTESTFQTIQERKSLNGIF